MTWKALALPEDRWRLYMISLTVVVFLALAGVWLRRQLRDARAFVAAGIGAVLVAGLLAAAQVVGRVQAQTPLDMADPTWSCQGSGGWLRRSASLEGADLRGKWLRSANLCWANARAALLEGADLHDAVLSKAQLVEANLRKVNLTGQARLDGANLKLAQLEDADLTDANLQNASLDFVRASRVTLRNAKLQNAQLQGAILRGADLRGRTLRTRFSSRPICAGRSFEAHISTAPSWSGALCLTKEQVESASTDAKTLLPRLPSECPGDDA
jgi:hypothetical protein